MTPPVNPRPFLASLVGKNIVVKLKWGMEYKGELTCADPYMNLQMIEVEEYLNKEKKGSFDQLLIRCNNVLFVRERNPSDDKVVQATPMEQEVKKEKEPEADKV